MGSLRNILGLSYQQAFVEMKVFPVGCPPLVFIPGFLFLAVGASMVTTWQSGHWRAAPGVITAFDGVDDSNKRECLVLVSYRYIVAGSAHLGSTFNLDRQGKVSMDEYQTLVSKYPVGKAVTIDYAPTDVEDSVLERSYGMAGTVALVGACLCGLGVVLTVANWRRLRVGEYDP